MNLFEPTVKRRSLISLTPLIDVVFILLLFFMLASNFSQSRMVSIQSSDAPRSAASVVSEKLVKQLYLESDEQVYLDGVAYDSESLVSAVTELLAISADLSVKIDVGEAVNVQSLLDLISALKQAGVVQVVMASRN